MRYKVTLIIDDPDDGCSRPGALANFIYEVLANCDLYVDKEQMQLEQIEEDEEDEEDEFEEDE
jgi:hypothetical protein